MPHASRVLLRYVAERWPFHLVLSLQADADSRRFVQGDVNDPTTRNWAKVVRGSELANHFARTVAGVPVDAGGDSASTWRKRIYRWLTDGRAPEPDIVRRTCAMLDKDWLLALGSVGYYRHAISLIHWLWKCGHRTDASLYAAAIFHWDDDAAALLRRRGPSKHLDEAKLLAWGNGVIPSAVLRPADLSDELLVVWGIVDGLERSARDDADPRAFENLMRNARPYLGRLAYEWSQRTKPKTPTGKSAA